MVDWNFALKILPKLLKASLITIQATIFGMGLALIIGLVLALCRRSRFKLLSVSTAGFIEFVRSTPLLVQLYFLFFILPLYGITMNAFTTGALGLGIHFGAYVSEVYRAGIEAVPRGQWEAATALNFSTAHTWIAVILPQAVPPMIPALGNYLIMMFKGTAQLSAITVTELLMTAKTIGSYSFRYLEAFTIVGIIFMALSYPSSVLIRRLEVRYGRSK